MDERNKSYIASAPASSLHKYGKLGVMSILLAAAAAGVGFYVSNEPPALIATFATVLAILGMVFAGLVITRDPKDPRLLFLAAGTCLLAHFAIHPSWDAVRIAADVGCGVAVVTALIVLLPRTAQYAVVSVLVVYHFAGILSAITSPPPQPWLSHLSWVTMFRPHLVFCYVNNAYQFYSPEPGPASLLWFCITDQNGDKQWFKFPRKPEPGLDPLGVEYSRRLSLTEELVQSSNAGIPPLAAQRRLLNPGIPRHPLLADAVQYRMLQDRALKLLSSYVRRVAIDYGKDSVQSMKVYRLQHRIPTASEAAHGWDPFDPASYDAYFLGEFDADGRMKDSTDSMLYWVIPIFWEDSLGRPVDPTRRSPQDAVRLVNYLEIHAGNNPFPPLTGSPGRGKSAAKN